MTKRNQMRLLTLLTEKRLKTTNSLLMTLQPNEIKVNLSVNICVFDVSLFLIVCARDPFVTCALVRFQNLMFTFRCSQARKRAIPLY